MRLAFGSHQRIEAFLRDHFQNENLKLPPIVVYSGRLAHGVTRTFGLLAITFGRRVFIAPDAVERDFGGRFTVSARLMAHEATHVLQYEKAGLAGFLVSYLREYGRGLRVQRSIGRAARRSAYVSNRYEREAYAAEHAYTHWSPPKESLRPGE